MKILLIDNHTEHLHNFIELFTAHDVEIQEYKPGLDFHTQGKDLVVLSGGGGEGFELKDTRDDQLWYEDEMKFVHACGKPLIGICMGFEVIAGAYGASVKPIGKLVSGFRVQQSTTAGLEHFCTAKLRQ